MIDEDELHVFWGFGILPDENITRMRITMYPAKLENLVVLARLKSKEYLGRK
jgi:hypothetical protein